jgi:hypothetical protein
MLLAAQAKLAKQLQLLLQKLVAVWGRKDESVRTASQAARTSSDADACDRYIFIFVSRFFLRLCAVLRVG